MSTKLAPFVAILTVALKVDVHRAKRERRTSRALHVRLTRKGYADGSTLLTDFIRQWRDKQGKLISARAFVLVAFELGETFQFDWSDK